MDADSEATVIFGGKANRRRNISCLEDDLNDYQSGSMNRQRPRRESFKFRPPRDDEIFITREKDKEHSRIAKEKQRSQRIWSKNTATSRAPLQRVKDRHIQPSMNIKERTMLASNSESNLQIRYNSQQRSAISNAMQIAKGRIQFQREKSSGMVGNINEFIDQKKQMFQVQLAYNTVASEINFLENKSNQRSIVLEKSAADLENDHVELMKFVELNNANKKKKEAEEKEMIKQKQDREDRLKRLENEIQNISSECDKNKEVLESYTTYKRFLEQLTPEETLRRIQQNHTEKHERLINAWIMKQEAEGYHSDDDIVFGQIEGIEGHEKYVPELLIGARNTSMNKTQTAPSQNSLSGNYASNRNNRGFTNAQMRDKMSRDDWRKRFDQLFQLNLIPVQELVRENYFQEETHFSEASVLDDIFNKLEEQNLYFIHKCQDIDELIEKKKKDSLKNQEKNEIVTQKHRINQFRLEQQIKAAYEELEELRSRQKVSNDDKPRDQNQESQRKSPGTGPKSNFDMISKLLDEKREEIIFQYHKNIDKDADLSAKDSLDILAEMEERLSQQLELIDFQQESNEKVVFAAEKQVKTNQKKESFDKINAMKLEKQRLEAEKSKARLMKKFVKQGRTRMARSKKTEVTKVQVTIKKSDEEIDRLKYLGDIDSLMMDQQHMLQQTQAK